MHKSTRDGIEISIFKPLNDVGYCVLYLNIKIEILKI